MIYSGNSREEELAFNDGKLVEGLGSAFSLYKANTAWAQRLALPLDAVRDLIAVSQFVENAKANNVTLKSSGLQTSGTCTLM